MQRNPIKIVDMECTWFSFWAAHHIQGSFLAGFDHRRKWSKIEGKPGGAAASPKGFKVGAPGGNQSWVGKPGVKGENPSDVHKDELRVDLD